MKVALFTGYEILCSPLQSLAFILAPGSRERLVFYAAHPEIRRGSRTQTGPIKLPPTPF